MRGKQAGRFGVQGVNESAARQPAKNAVTPRRLFAALALVLALSPASANALTLFGTVENIDPIQDVNLTSPDGEALFLGYKTTTSYFLGGLSMSNDGYVLVLRSNHDRFLDLPEGEALKSFQAKGLLPDPLPPYSPGVIDYLRGYSLWVVVAVLLAAYAVGFALRRRRPRY
jgi:hypothetical protein